MNTATVTVRDTDNPITAVRHASLNFCNAVSRGRAGMHVIVGHMHRLCEAIELAIAAGCESPAIRRAMHPARVLQGRSPFIHRLQTWPKGYPGDFETVEWLASCKPQCELDDPIYWIEWYALNCPIAQQHRNKLAWQHKLMVGAAAEGGRILSIGCGEVADVAINPQSVSGAEFVLLDMDRDALRLAQKRLAAARSVAAINDDVVRGLKEIVSKGPYDLIICGGLFDYLEDGKIARLLSALYARALRPQGLLAFTNIGDLNPFRVWMEYLASWTLIHRSAADIRRIVLASNLNTEILTLECDPSGLTWLCSIVK